MKLSEEVALIKESIEELRKQIKQIEEDVAKIKVDSANTIKSAGAVKPGTAIKVSFNKYGLIETTHELKISDLPDIPPSKILTLNTFNEKVMNRFKTIDKQIAMLETTVKSIPKQQAQQKVSIKLDDIPELPITKIKDLKETLELISISKPEVSEQPKTKLLESDIPEVIKNRIKVLEELIASKAEKTEVSEINVLIKSLSQQNNDIVQEIINISDAMESSKKGLKPEDIPELPISKIKNLGKILNAVPSRADIISINQLIDATNSATSSSFKVMREALKGKVSQEAFKTLSTEILVVDEKVNKLIEIQAN